MGFLSRLKEEKQLILLLKIGTHDVTLQYFTFFISLSLLVFEHAN